MPSGVRRNLPIYAVTLLAFVGAACVAIALVYFAQPAKSLPTFLPGHQVGSSHHHTTHGIAALIVGLVCIIGAWMGGGRSSR
jgi:hypothetical protein